ncbi:MAG: hypothetical protein PHP86_14210 [Nevskiales bacterium]|nr:hypothetical protein [Nevskiales bacterium]
MRAISVSFLIAGSTAITGCGWMEGDSDGGNSDRITATSVSIESYSVTGTSPTLLPSAPKPISASNNGGAFTIQWDASANGIVDIELSVKEADGTIDFCADGPHEFYDRPCGGDYACQLQMTLDCTFGNDNRIDCTGGKGVDLSGFLDQIPKQADLQIKVRGRNTVSCSSERVEFR